MDDFLTDRKTNPRAGILILVQSLEYAKNLFQILRLYATTRLNKMINAKAMPVRAVPQRGD